MNQLLLIFKEILYLGAISSILILLILLIKKLFNKVLSPKWHYYIWGLLLLRLLVPYYPEASMSVFNLFYIVAEQVNIPVDEIDAPFQGNSGKDSTINLNSPNETANETITNNSSPIIPSTTTNTTVKVKDSTSNSFMMTMAFLWTLVVLLLSIYTIIVNTVFAINVRRRYTRLKDARIVNILEDCKSIMKVNQPITLLTSNKRRTPSLYVSFHTKILVSKATLEQLSDREIKYIFLHELSHYKRKDIAINWILALLQIIYFFNPLIWYAFYKIHEDCEISCDAAALQYVKEEEYQNYGSTVIKLIKLISESNFIPATAGIWKNKSSYKRRIIMISKFKKSKWTSTLLSIILIVSVALIGLTGCSLSGKEDAYSDNTDVSSTTTDTDITEIPTVTNYPTPVITEAPVKEEADNQGDPNITDTEQSDPTAPAQEGSATTEPARDDTAGAEPVRDDTVAAEAAQRDEVFYGDWVINSVLAYGSAGTYSKEDAESLVGKSLSFSADKATCFGDEPSYLRKVATNPEYLATEITSSDFVTNYRMTFDKLGLEGDTVTEITAVDSERNGCTFFVKDKDTLIVYGGGTYFELVR
ncbi:MAG: peptidase BlaR1 [Herbinix sp.]|jgi:bla regulator protein BlaR1|nr:peptidase BlaR1 [Herbinix sp.]